MNKAEIAGRAVRDAVIRRKEDGTIVAKYTIAVDRPFKSKEDKEAAKAAGKETADFISCTAFGKRAEFAEKYVKQGTGWIVTGRIQTGSYLNKDHVKVYTTEIMVEEQEFPPSNGQQSPARQSTAQQAPAQQTGDTQGEYMAMPDMDDLMNDPDLPWS